MEKVPHEAEANNKIAVRHARGSIIIIFPEERVHMFGNQENSGLAHACIEEHIDHGEIPDFFLGLHKEFTEDWIVIVGIEFCEIVDGCSSLHEHGAFEPVVGIKKTAAEGKFGYVEYGLTLIHLLVECCDVPTQTSELELTIHFYREIIDTFGKLVGRDKLLIGDVLGILKIKKIGDV